MEGKAINLFNINARRSIENAPVKGQCSRDYFYGKDLRAENALANLEGHYTRVATALIDGNELNAKDEDWLRLFVIVQSRRTASAIEELRNYSGGMMDEVFKRHPDQRPEDLNHEQLVAMSMSAGVRLHDYSRDLKFVVLRNRTCVEFVTSDHPAIITNKYSFEKLKDESFGMSNSGIILSFPVSPKLSVCFFDKGVYTVSIPSGTRYVELRNVADVQALNALQHLHAHKNIYFSSWDDSAGMSEQAKKAERERSKAKPKFATFVRDKDAAGEVYRTGSQEEQAQGGSAMISGSFHHPHPVAWPSIVKYRPKIVTFTNGSAVGHVRKEEWLRTRPGGEKRK
jgi:hypothetical protein